MITCIVENIGTVDACVQYLAHSSSFLLFGTCLCLSEIEPHAVHRKKLSALANEQRIHLIRRCAVDDLAPDVRPFAVCTVYTITTGVFHHVLKEIKNEAGTLQ